ncbi:Na+/H+ antiporter [Streptacidiphilus sp. PB12-B1b]|uniref:Na+/H+ antiporter n=1 Tax=Streptacidiphilus sp. PB12-B1b TaxID=2705012 RepID=UPI0015FC83E1|nr:Na+/H+ antiporter [Streptacidiphilus sp. PB12-B1b]QMU75924.1 Na+/H+ antiporter [Streptacidiphilus sp. PB12-B1b]
MTQLILLFCVLLAAIVSTPVAERVGVPQPVLMTLIGIVLAVLPFVPNVTIAPDLILPLVLPPLIYAAAQRSTTRYFRANSRVILLLAVFLVLVTTAAVALACHWIVPALPVGAAIALGALVSPPDPIAAAAVASSVGLPRRLMGILETEGLFNDVTALVVYGLAVDAVVKGSFSTLEAVERLVLSAVLAVVLGVGLGWLSGKVMGLLHDPTLQVALSLLVPFAAYILADELHGSGMLAVLVCSLWINDQTVGADDVGYRLVGEAFWDVVELLISGMAFGLIGLELASVLSTVGRHWTSMIGDAALVIVVVVGVRLLWLLPGAWVTHSWDRARGVREEAAPIGWRESVVLWWSGMRGVASVALALALPYTVDGGGAFPQRSEIVFVAFCVVLFTLLVQGLTLPAVVRRLGLSRDQDAEDAAERQLWYRVSKAGLRRLKELAAAEEIPDDLVDRLKQRQTDRLARHRPDMYDEEQQRELRERVSRVKQFAEVEQAMLAAGRQEMQVARMEPGADPELVDRVIRKLDLRSNPR